MYNVCTLTRFLTINHYVFRPTTRQQIFTSNARLRTERSAKICAPTVMVQFQLTEWRRCGADGLNKGSFFSGIVRLCQVTFCSTSDDVAASLLVEFRYVNNTANDEILKAASGTTFKTTWRYGSCVRMTVVLQLCSLSTAIFVLSSLG